MKQILKLATKQSLKMTPQLQQAIKLLQLSSLELETELKNAIETNPMLEAIEVYEDNHTPDLPVEAQWSNVENYLNCDNASQNYDFYNSESNKAAPITLRDHLIWQLNLTTMSDHDYLIAMTIIDSIGETGYLLCSLEELHYSLQNNYLFNFEKITINEIEIVLQQVQQFDPIGVASRNLQECMLLQLNSLPITTPLLDHCKEIVNTMLENLAQKQYNIIKQKLKINEQELQAIIHTLTSLNPHPGERISSPESEYIIPDVTVIKKNKRWIVELNQDYSNKVQLNANYAALIKRADNSRDNQFLRDQLTEAKWFLNSLKNRNETLLNVATVIVQHQQQFLELGPEFMQPLKLIDVANAVGLNESTISRVTTNKYLHSPRGVFELKYFFSSSLNHGGVACSATAIKAILKRLISNEAPHKPLSDQELTELLKQQGIAISRRTTAKYRESLGLESSNQRKVRS